MASQILKRASEFAFDKEPSTNLSSLDRTVLAGRDVHGNGFIFSPGSCTIASLDDAEVSALGSVDNLATPKTVDCQDYGFLSEYIQPISRNGGFRQRTHSFGVALIVTQVCNLTCSYCLAKQGSFGLEVATMSCDEIVARLDAIIQERPDICFVKFFGGEPTLRMDIVTTVSKYIRETLGRDDILIALTTNGTFDAKKHIEVWKKYRISLSVSIDGPEEVHDAERVNSSGQGSFAKAIRYTEVLKEHDFPFCAIGVFDNRHIKNGYSYIDTIRFLNTISPLTKVQFVEALGDAVEGSDIDLIDTDQAKDEIVKAVDFIFSSINGEFLNRNSDNWVYDNNIYRFFSDVIRKLAFPFRNFCTASSLLTIFPDGDIHSCYTLTDNENLQYGSKHTSPSELSTKQRDFAARNTWENIGAIGQNVPWYRGIVGDICLSDMINSSDPGYESSAFYKCFQQEASYRVLQHLASISNDPVKLARVHHASNEHQRLTGSFLYGIQIPESVI